MPVVAAIPAIVKVGSAVKGVVGAIGAVKGAKGAKSANATADKLSKEAQESGRRLQETAKKMSDQASERWDFYQNHGKNVDIMMIDDAVNMFKETFSGGSERAAARAAEDVASAFDRSAEVRKRAALRFGGVDPTSGKFQGLERKLETARASEEAAARFKARRTEEDRARQVMGNASDLANRSLNQANQFERTGIAADKTAADIFSTQQTDARAEAAGSAALVGDIAGKIPFEKMFGDKTTGGGPAVSGSSDDGPMGPPEESEPKTSGKGFRSGGVIPGDGRGGGRIKGRGTGTSDSVRAVVDGTNQPVRLSAGEFIIPEKVVRQRGERFFNQLIKG